LNLGVITPPSPNYPWLKAVPVLIFLSSKTIIQTEIQLEEKFHETVFSYLFIYILIWSTRYSIAYEYQGLDKTQRSLLRENHLLHVEWESLRSLDRVQLLAKNKIGLREPESRQIVTVFLKK